MTQENLSPNLAILRLIVTPETEAISQAQSILGKAKTVEECAIKDDSDLRGRDWIPTCEEETRR